MQSRRRLIPVLLVSALTAVLVLAGCQDSATTASTQMEQKQDSPKQETNPAGGGGQEAAAPAQITDLKESPFFQGKGLAAVKDRLPTDYKITNEIPADQMKYEIGSYGGNLRTVTSVVDWDADVFVMNNEPLLNTPGILGDEITGNVLKDYKVSDDQKTFTFTMRKGMKWSDGKPVTTEDVRFTVEDVLNNPEITPIFPVWLRSGGVADGSPMKLEVVDDYTFKLSFDRPYGGILIRFAIQGWRGYPELIKPAHYLKQFHKKYTPMEKLGPLIKEAGFQKGEWANLFNDKDITNTELTQKKAIGFPVLYPWIQTKHTQTTTTYERNPYYFKVDPAGNQLPYIDTITSTLVQDIEMVGLKTIAGEVDFSRESAALIKMPLYKENEKSGFKANLANMHVTPTDVFLNMTYDNSNWQKVVQDVRFRKALSLALNREEIISTLYYDFAKPGNIEDATFDLEQANQLLDDMGMKKDSDGKRLGPDGKVFTIPFEVGAQAPDIVPLTQLIVEMWKQLGLDVTMKTIDQKLWDTKNTDNQLQASMMWTHTPLWYMGDWGLGLWAPAWNDWKNSGGKKGKEPPENVKKLYDLIDQAAAEKPEEAKKLIEKVKQELKDNVYYLIPISEVKQPLIVNAKLHNIPDDAAFAIAVNFSGEQFFFGQ
ncbi:peptide/nickel transport system substrate-binding protein [Paenibacillus rhizosphaerae]|uniref:Peptide/nickel transport system substrate-binding protein n=1 Tax=Paenibacillus rhizosphaerae TaxID=297318 RepID=A0A839TUW7_9BACL|nr:ABC transporter substrate-binding protein [Paenibacillus rhizosphaerae]MBB3128477.1 peptide/nickel transport system substrate-binding protein [Paenibacillus rhizosphaerae]